MTVLWARKGFDGVVQVAPFGCTPEIVAKSILPRVSQEYGIPVMSLFFDEQTGPAGVYTRLEAFVDLLYARRRARRGEESRNGSLSRH
jgi:predicted nucleotide-binding protein (sugar kinase/HSP70/actin superfamily)